MFARKGGLAGAGGADQHDQAKFGNIDVQDVALVLWGNREHGHLCRSTEDNVRFADGVKAHVVAKALGLFPRPLLELLTGPLETVVRVAETVLPAATGILRCIPG